MNKSDPQEFLVYADGSCLGNPGPGGWGVVIIEPGGAESEHSGGSSHTTNNRMELTAAIEGLRRLPPGARVLLRSDSEYLVKSINLKWRRNANLDLWRELDAEIARRAVKFEWVRGHAADELNNRADRLALAQARGVLAEGKPARRVREPAPPSPGEGLAARLEPLLEAGERLARCATCGEVFVASGPERAMYCNRAACQLRMRTR